MKSLRQTRPGSGGPDRQHDVRSTDPSCRQHILWEFVFLRQCTRSSSSVLTFWDNNGRLDDWLLDLSDVRGHIRHVRKVGGVAYEYSAIPIDHFVWYGWRSDYDICVVLILQSLSEDIHMQ